ncbi:MAG: polysaccharide export protein [Leptolyngbyaceae cyanobacterium SL_7_1]|nr:polysaccharide export protein [Leptolyngbyaceae cyanobacterium SL_7_1]
MLKLSWSRHFYRSIAAGLASTYAIGLTLPFACLLWGLANPSARAQPQPVPRPNEPTPSQDSLQEARENLLTPSPSFPQPGSQPDDGRVPSNSLPLQAPPPLAPEFDLYRLGAGDAIFVNVLRFPDLTFQATIDLEGNILAPLVGALQLQGLTIEQARELFRNQFNQFVVNPEVDVILVAQRPVQVTLAGEVVRPGLYPLQSPQLAVAIASAGGTTRLADLRSVRVRRYLDNGTVLEQNIDLYAALQTANAIPDIRLADGDMVVIPSLTGEASTTYDRQLVARTTLAQQQIIVRVLNYSNSVGVGRGSAPVIRGIELPNGSNFVDALLAISPNPTSADLSDVALIRFDPNQGRRSPWSWMPKTLYGGMWRKALPSNTTTSSSLDAMPSVGLPIFLTSLPNPSGMC